MQLIRPLLLATLSLVGMTACAQSQAHDIEFITDDYPRAIAESQRQNKPIFVDIHTTWCAPCKRMENEVFTVDSVAKFYNGHFINLQLDAEKSQNLAIVKRFKVRGFPTLLFLDGQGTEKRRVLGGLSPDLFMMVGREEAGLELSVDSLITLQSKGKTSSEEVKQLLQKVPQHMQMLDEDERTAAMAVLIPIYKSYIAQHAGKDLETPEGFELLSQYAECGAEAKTEVLDLIAANFAVWQNVVGQQAFTYVMLNNDLLIYELARSGNLDYKKQVAKVDGAYRAAYASSEGYKVKPIQRATLIGDAVYELQSNDEITPFMASMNQLFSLADNYTELKDLELAINEVAERGEDGLTRRENMQYLAWVKGAYDRSPEAFARALYLVQMGQTYVRLGRKRQARSVFSMALKEPGLDKDIYQKNSVAAMVNYELQNMKRSN